MPELPEVEATRLSFASAITGAVVLGARTGKPLRWPLGCEPAHLAGRRVTGVRRRGKYLLMDLDRGVLLLHLGMSGSLRFGQDMGEPGAHDHFDLRTTLGTLRLNDPRRFGAVVFAANEGDPVAHKLLGKLGVEPLSEAFDAQHFWQALRHRQTAIKQVLLAGEVVVGVGNIYACEALFEAGLRPSLRAARLTRAQAHRLHASVRHQLLQALSLGGSTLRNFSNAQGQPGHFQLQTKVYGRAGLPCRVCTTPVKVVRQGQRSSYYCPHCQKS